jgi:RNA polymerase sigma-70 factor (ECF subfamily)
MVDLSQRLLALCEEGEAQWPDLRVERVTFVAFVASRLAVDRDAGEALAGIRASDLYLTCACAAGDIHAVKAFDAQYIREVDYALARLRPGAEEVDEVKQLVRQKLFVAEQGAVGKIVDYSGRGDLRRWVRSIAIRTCLNLRRKNGREVLRSDDRVLDGVGRGDDPEVEYMKRRYQNEFRIAFLTALRELDDRQQNLLRYHHVDGLNIDEIGAIYRVHRVTAYRWLEKARDALVTRTQKLLKAQLKVEKQEFESIMRMIRSQIHLSLVRHLGAGQDGDSDQGGDDS